ncbi:uncharacterized protein METZ01_LOCUS134177, partial [marine metagenome]
MNIFYALTHAKSRGRDPQSPPNPLLSDAYSNLMASCSGLLFSALYGGR